MTQVSPQQLSRWLTEHGPGLVLYAEQWCRTPEDVVQEAFLQLVLQPELPQNVRAWLYRVVRNGAINASRAAIRRSSHETAAACRSEPWFDRSADELLDADEATEALKCLPADERETIVARLWGGLSFAEIAQVTGSSISTAFRRYRAGIQALRERLGAQCQENETV